MSYLTKLNAQKQSLNNFWAPEKVCDENEETTKEKTTKNVIDGGRPFIRHTQRTGENDLNDHCVSDSGHNEGTICLLNRRIGAKGIVLERGCTNGCYFTPIGWYSGLVVLISSIVGLLIYIVRMC